MECSELNFSHLLKEVVRNGVRWSSHEEQGVESGFAFKGLGGLRRDQADPKVFHGVGATQMFAASKKGLQQQMRALWVGRVVTNKGL